MEKAAVKGKEEVRGVRDVNGKREQWKMEGVYTLSTDNEKDDASGTWHTL
jgi:hypothetical protein